MAIKIERRKVFGRAQIYAVLLDAVEATTDGEWVHVANLHPLAFDVSGITTATVQLRGSLQAARPSDEDDHHEIYEFTEDGLVGNSMIPIEWIKAMVSAYTSGTITVIMRGSEGN